MTTTTALAFGTDRTPDEVLTDVLDRVRETGVPVLESSAVPHPSGVLVSVSWPSDLSRYHRVLAAVGRAVEAGVRA